MTKREVTTDDREAPVTMSVMQRVKRLPDPTLDVALAVMLGTAMTIAIAVSPQQGAPPNALTYALGWTIAVLVLFRRRWPLAVLVASAITLIVYHQLPSPGVFPALPLSVALASAWAAGHRLASILVTAWFAGSPLVFWALYLPERLPGVLRNSVPDMALFATAILLGEAVRGRRALAREQERSERLLLNVLPAPIAARLKDTTGVIADEFADVSVLFADIVDFTTRAQRVTAEQVVATLNDLFSVFDELARERGLEKIKTIGDAYMVVGGLPDPRLDHAEAVAEMALAVRDEVAGRFEPGGHSLAVRMGIDTGPVVAGVIGRSKFSYDLWGDTVNTASRMESHGIPGQIQVTPRTYERLRHGYRFECRGPIDVKGKGRIVTYLLLGRN
jgi:class 3 adenylate cyclase